jgi:UDP-N-acetylmuramoylalanine--D-glutamate ligase
MSAGRVLHVAAGTLERAVELAASDPESADLAEPVVLLSPACTSFNQLRNFEARG